MECVQLAAAFACPSLLALLPNAPACWRLVYSTHGRPAREGDLAGTAKSDGRKRASARESGSKLHALQSSADLKIGRATRWVRASLACFRYNHP